ncbi:MAG TPA: hypothetical protein VNZ54_09490, partial [bacterium]|nr:hypothetical protein [bacterium]
MIRRLALLFAPAAALLAAGPLAAASWGLPDALRQVVIPALRQTIDAGAPAGSPAPTDTQGPTRTPVPTRTPRPTRTPVPTAT